MFTSVFGELSVEDAAVDSSVDELSWEDAAVASVFGELSWESVAVDSSVGEFSWEDAEVNSSSGKLSREEEDSLTFWICEETGSFSEAAGVSVVTEAEGISCPE